MRVNTYLSANDLHVPTQFSYKQHHNCEMFLLKLIDILVTIDSKLESSLISLQRLTPLTTQFSFISFTPSFVLPVLPCPGLNLSFLVAHSALRLVIPYLLLLLFSMESHKAPFLVLFSLTSTVLLSLTLFLMLVSAVWVTLMTTLVFESFLLFVIFLLSFVMFLLVFLPSLTGLTLTF
jgi:hypothetical protein